MEHCQGEDYSNPVNVICAQSLDRFDEVNMQADKTMSLQRG
uniref:Uncharacterized protein n=1 Tax=Arundo donax TaxID=35708 RepID=A0A0A8YP20_ARUDO